MSYQLTFVGYIWLYTPSSPQPRRTSKTSKAFDWSGGWFRLMGSWRQSVFFAPVAEKLDPTDTYGMKKCICCMRHMMLWYSMVWYGMLVYIYNYMISLKCMTHPPLSHGLIDILPFFKLPGVSPLCATWSNPDEIPIPTRYIQLKYPIEISIFRAFQFFVPWFSQEILPWKTSMGFPMVFPNKICARRNSICSRRFAADNATGSFLEYVRRRVRQDVSSNRSLQRVPRGSPGRSPAGWMAMGVAPWIKRTFHYNRSWWFMMVYDGLWWFMMVYDGSWWFMMVHDGLWWLIWN